MHPAVVGSSHKPEAEFRRRLCTLVALLGPRSEADPVKRRACAVECRSAIPYVR